MKETDYVNKFKQLTTTAVVTTSVLRLLRLPASSSINTLRSRQNGRQCPDHNFKCISLNENKQIWINISLKFVPKGVINNITAFVQIMAWR